MSATNRTVPIFILSTARAGSTLLRFILNAHPEVAAPPETHLLELVKRLLWTHRTLTGEQDDTVAWPQAISQARADADRIMDKHALEQSASRWCEKSVSSLQHVDVLQQVYPDADLLCLYRHPADFIQSALREDAAGYGFEPYFAAHPGVPAAGLLQYWLERTQSMLTLEASELRTQRLRYEDLVTNTQPQLDMLQEFLQLEPIEDWNGQIFASDHLAGPGDHRIYATNSVHTNSVGTGAQTDWSGVPRNLIKKVNRCLEALAYDSLS